MDQSTKQRLVGITVVFAVAVIFLPMILDGGGVRKNNLEVIIPPRPVVESNPEFDLKMVELQARVEALPDLQPRFVDEVSSESENLIEPEEVKPKDTADAHQNKKLTDIDLTRPGGDSWVLQVGSFKDRAKAISERDLMRKSNIAAVFIEQFKIQDTISYRVRLGPFLNREQSKVAQNKIKSKHNIDGLIMKYEK